jgi:surface antigen
VVDFEPSSDMDDLFGFSAPDSVPAATPAPQVFSGLTPQAQQQFVAPGAPDAAAPAQPSSRRAAREAEGARPTTPAAPADNPFAALEAPPYVQVAPTRASQSKRSQKAVKRSAQDRQRLSRPPSDRKAVARAARDLGPEPAARKLQRHELALMNAQAPKPPRKNPLSVLLTMAAVGGMFAVVGLPAYALSPIATSANKTEADPQSIVVSADATALAVTRDGYHATTEADLEEMDKDALRAAQNEAYNASGARAMGDDYPWPYELMEGQGGGLSPLNYYYRECVDFVAWRLNRDAGSYSAPFKWVWSNLTPFGGNGGQWEYNWEQHGWPVSDTPIKGAVAYTGGNHVAYVKSLNADGTITIEEYNYIHGMYGQRTMTPASIVAAGGAFLYPPPS